MNFNMDDEIDEVVNLIKNVTSCSLIREIKKHYEYVYQEASCDEIYYITRKSVGVTKFDVTLSDGEKVAEITINGDCDTVTKETHEAIINFLKTKSEKILPILDNKIQLIENERKESNRKSIWFILITAFSCYCVYLILLYLIKYK